MILFYAFAKILGTQFTTQPSVYDQPISSLSGFNLTWYYFGYSFWYGIFIAASQILSSLLLFFRKTTRLGIVLFLSFMVNILLLDYAYDIDGAKGMATIMTIMALFVFLSDYKVFFKYFWTEPDLFSDNDRPGWIKILSKAKWIFIPIIFVGIFLGISTLKAKFLAKDQLYGTWLNTEKTSEYQYFNFEVANTFKINGIHNIDRLENGFYSVNNDTLTLKVYENKFKDNPDKSKTTILMMGKFQFKDSVLIIQNANEEIKLKRIR
jgi:hypothetical protein